MLYVKKIMDNQFDVIALQEVSTKLIHLIIEKKQYPYHYFAPYPDEDGEEGLAVLSRHPITLRISLG